MNITQIDTLPQSGIYLACIKAAQNQSHGKLAFLTWCTTQVLGWSEAKKLTSRSKWYRHLKIFRDAGLPIPTLGDLRTITPLTNPPELWFGTKTREQLIDLVSQNPSRIMLLPNTQFSVTDLWDTKKGWKIACSAGCLIADYWPVDTAGVVTGVLFDGLWQVEVEHNDASLDDEVRWCTIPLGEFLRRTAPVTAS